MASARRARRLVPGRWDRAFAGQITSHPFLPARSTRAEEVLDNAALGAVRVPPIRVRLRRGIPCHNPDSRMLSTPCNRPLANLRLSVTDRCNLRCQYCMPEQDYVWLPREDILQFEEIDRLVDVFLDARRAQGAAHRRRAAAAQGPAAF